MRKLIVFILFLVCCLHLQAAYLKNVPVAVVQPNGDTVHCFVTGDEFYNYLHDIDNYTIIQDENTGYYVYAILDENGELAASQYVVGQVNPRMVRLTPNLRISDEAYRRKRESWEIPIRYALPQTRYITDNQGVINNIVIFIRFADHPYFSSNTYYEIDQMFNSLEEGYTSMKRYYLDASYNRLTINTTFYPEHDGSIIMSYQDGHTRSYFTPYNAVSNPEGYNGDTQRREREFELLENAVAFINATSPIPDSLNIDANNDGLVDNVCFIIDDTYTMWNNLLWPHQWELFDRDVNINGKRVYSFNFQLANSGSHYFSPSTLSHEMFHSLGAPDLYRYSQSFHNVLPVGSWDLMGTNGTPPQQMTAYMKYKYGRWIDSIPEITEYGYYTLNALTDSGNTNNCYKIATGQSSQWYILEYRNTDEGSSIPGSGLLIYRVNTNFNGSADYNNTSILDEVYVFRPDASDNNTNGNIYSAHFSRNTGRTSFSHSSNPHPFYSDGTIDSNLVIQNISSAGKTIGFYYGTTDCAGVSDIQLIAATDTSYTFRWTGNATSYEIEYGAQGFGMGSGTRISVESQSCTIDNFPENSDVELYVRALCEDGRYSLWSDAFQFRTNCSSIPAPWIEVFATSNIPECWNQEQITGSESWRIKAEGVSGNNHTSRQSCASLDNDESDVYSITKLITPPIDLTNVPSPYISFWHKQQKLGNAQDSLFVYYRQNIADNWHYLCNYTDNIPSWTRRVIDLPNPSSTYQIAFEGHRLSGKGIQIDSILVTGMCVADTSWFYDEICQGEYYRNHGFYISHNETSTPGTLTRILRLAPHNANAEAFAIDGSRCESYAILTLTVLPTSHTVIDTAVCHSLVWGDSIYTQTGIYVHHYDNAVGCDSTVTLNLTIYPIENTASHITACNSYTWTDGTGLTYSEEGIYTYSHQNENNCPEVDTLYLIIHYTDTVYLEDYICQGEAYNGYGFDIPADSTMYPHTIVETVCTPSLQTGCDSCTVLTLGVLASSYTSVMTESCDSYTWNDSIYTVSGNYVQHFRAANGCDSTVSLQLTIFNSANTEFSANNCVNYKWNDRVYTASGDYIQHFETVNGCDSTVTLHLTIFNTEETEFSDSNCVSYIWNDSVYTASGDYIQHFETVNGCDSTVTLHLTIFNTEETEFSASNCDSYTWNDSVYTTSGDKIQHFSTIHGCDSTVTLHLTIFNSTETEFSASNCDSYTWNDSVYTTSGDKIQHFNTIHGCDSTVTLHLTIFNSTETEFSDSNCDSYTWNDSVYTTSGDKTQNFSTIHGCDSTVTLHLTIFNSTETEFSISSCVSYIWNDSIYTTSGDKIQHFNTIHGCDSTVTIHLTINSIDTVIFNESICQGESYNGHGFNIPADSTMIPHVIVETLNFASIQTGCDSITILNLTVNAPLHRSTTVTACEEYIWTDGDNRTYSESGIYTYSHPDINNCTQVDTLHLTIGHHKTNYFDLTVCGSYTWNDSVYTTSGEKTQILKTSKGCDSTVTIKLTILPVYHIYDTVESCDYYNWDNRIYLNEGDYDRTFRTVDGCDSIVSIHLTLYPSKTTEFSDVACEYYIWNDSIYTVSGDYVQHLFTSHGCDSSVTLHLTIKHGIHTATYKTAAERYTWQNGSGITYTESGTYTYSYINEEGCTNTDTLHLIVNKPTHQSFTVEACEIYTWTDGSRKNYTESGMYLYRHADNHGCIEVDTLFLTIHNPEHQSYTSIAYDSYNWHGTSYDTSGTYTYEHLDENGCTQVDTLHLTVYYSSSGEFSATACEAYQWNDSIYYVSGDYIQKFEDIHGCDSTVTLHLTVNHPDTVFIADSICQGELYTEYGFSIPADSTMIPHVIVETVCTPSLQTGCDSCTVLTLTVLPHSYTSIMTESCDSYTWNDSTYTVSGDYIQHFQAANGCDSIVTLHLTVNHPDTVFIADSICQGEAYNGYGFNIPADSTIYPHVIVETRRATSLQTGCDSITVLTLTVLPHSYTSIMTESCDSYTWNDSTYTVSGDYILHFQAANGCDSTVTLHLTVNQPDTVFLADSICQGELYTEYGFNIPADSTMIPHVIVETRRATSLQTGCDSCTVLTLTVLPHSYTSIMTESCDSYTWNDSIYTTSGDYVQHFQAANGCDSIVTLHLTINQPDTVFIADSICQGEAYNGYGFNIPADSTMYPHVIVETVCTPSLQTGCDSCTVLTLTVLPHSYTSIMTESCDSYTWNDSIYTVSGDYIQHFQAANGCDSTVTLHLTVNHPDTVFIADSICQGEAYNGYGFNIPADSTMIPHVIVETRRATSLQTGCDSCTVLTLTVLPHSYTSVITESFDSYTWNDSTYTVSGNYIQHFQAANGCDSIVTLHLTVNHPDTVFIADSICQGEAYNGYGFNIPADSTIYPHVIVETRRATSLQTGCDSCTVLTLTVLHHSYTSIMTESCDSYTWNDSTYPSSGDYIQHFQAVNGCDSIVTLHLTVNHPDTVFIADSICQGEAYNGYGFDIPADSTMYPHVIVETVCTPSLQTGCDSCTVLTLTVLHHSYTSIMTESCDSYTWNDSTYTSSSDYVQHFQAANGCDSIVTLHLTVNHGTHNVQTETACETYTWHDTTYTTSGTYTYSYDNTTGCPSVDTLHLTVNHGTHNVQTETACETYTWHDTTYTTSGTYTYSYDNTTGCPSVDTLHLTINHSVTVLLSDSICQGEAYNGYGFDIPADSTMIPHVIVETVCTPSLQTGCDSCTVLTLTVLHHSYTSIMTESCDSYTWNDSTYTSSGDYVQHFQAANGCDSIVTLHLTIFNSAETEFTDSSCVSYRWNDSIYTASGDYIQHFQTIHGCDSTVTLHLTINQPDTVFLADSICQGEAYSGYGFNIPADSTIYPHVIVETRRATSLQTGCDSCTVLALTVLPHSYTSIMTESCDSYTWNDSTYTVSGDYIQHFQAANGCDSIVTIHLTIFNSAETEFTDSSCVNYTWNDSIYTASGDYIQHFQTIHGCDSTVTMHLTINQPDTVFLADSICQGEAYSGYGFNIPADSTIYPHVIVETRRATSLQTGCDSCTVLALTVLPHSYTSIITESCDSYSWNDSIYTTSGDYVQHFQAANGCDSIVTIHLTIFNSAETEFTDSSCVNYTWNDSIYTASGDYIQHFQTIHGCDSTVTLHLTINQPDTIYLTDSVYVDELYNLYGFNIPSDSTKYQRTIVETIYSTSQLTGCDSVTILTLIVYKADNIRTPETQLFSIKVYPVPAHSTLHIESEANNELKSIQCFSSNGSLVFQDFSIHNAFYIMDVSNYASGQYILRIQTAQGILSKKIVIQR